MNERIESIVSKFEHLITKEIEPQELHFKMREVHHKLSQYALIEAVDSGADSTIADLLFWVYEVERLLAPAD